MTNYIIPSTTQADESISLAGLSYPCRITDLRRGVEYILETPEGTPINLAGQGNMDEQVGTTSERPSLSGPSAIPYFDTTLGKPIWFNGTDWVDANGQLADS